MTYYIVLTNHTNLSQYTCIIIKKKNSNLYSDSILKVYINYLKNNFYLEKSEIDI